jgi:hypothetical protein
MHSRLAGASAATASAEQHAAEAEAAAGDLRQQLEAAEGRAHDREQQAVVLQSQVPSWLPIPATILPLPLLEVVLGTKESLVGSRHMVDVRHRPRSRR